MVYKGDRNYAIYAGAMEVDRPKMAPRGQDQEASR